MCRRLGGLSIFYRHNVMVSWIIFFFLRISMSNVDACTRLGKSTIHYTGGYLYLFCTKSQTLDGIATMLKARSSAAEKSQEDLSLEKQI